LEINEQDGHLKWDEFLAEVGRDDKFAANQLDLFAKKVA